jgi:hypothetical protein
MPRVALPVSLQLCKISGCLYTPCVQDQQIFGFIVDQTWTLQTSATTSSTTSSFDAPFQNLVGYPRILGIVI